MSVKSFDEQLRELVKKEFDENRGQRLTSAYGHTLSKLQQEVYPHIQGQEPNLSDHGIRHIENVQQNVVRLLSEDGLIRDLSGIEMYCLGMCILFHDTGNVYGRENHQGNVAEVFDSIRGTDASLRHEKTLVVHVTRAHTGTAQDGSYDTLKEVNEIDHLEGESVRLRELAAILRFADELAEGPQRTSEFMQSAGLYDSESLQFHKYANSTHILIERGTKRVVLTYEIEIDVNLPDELRSSLNVIYNRIRKVNQERQYARYYSRLLDPFKITEISFNFHCNGQVLETELLPVKLTDIVVPGDYAKEISDIDPAYSINQLVDNLISRCNSREAV